MVGFKVNFTPVSLMYLFEFGNRRPDLLTRACRCVICYTNRHTHLEEHFVSNQ